MERIKDANHNESPNEQYDEVASVLNPNNIKFAGDVKENIKFPDIKVNWDDESDFWDKRGIVLKWLAGVVNKDGSWKYNVSIPKEWQEQVDKQLEARRRNYENEKEERRKTIEWIKTSKNIDINLDHEYGTGQYFSELPEEQKNPIRQDKEMIVESLNPYIEKTNSMRRIEGLSSLAEETFRTFMFNYSNVITDSTVGIINKQMQTIANVAYNNYPDDGGIRAVDDEYTKNDNKFYQEIYEKKPVLSTAIEVANFSGDDRIIDTYMDTIVKHPLLSMYAKIHPIDNRRVEAYIKNVVPLINKKDTEVQRLWDDHGRMLGFASVFSRVIAFALVTFAFMH